MRGDEVEEKAHGELVSIVDREVEVVLSKTLPSLIAGSSCIGEEACAANPGLLSELGSGWVWLIDPIDGTRNFVAGDDNFVVMVALLYNGDTVASWIYSPVAGWLATAEAGAGAYIDDVRVSVEGNDDEKCAQGALYTSFLPPSASELIASFTTRFPDLRAGTGSAGCDYVALVRKELGFLLFWRTLAWDHAPGALFVTEAGARIAHLDGSPYRATEPRSGLLTALSDEIWHPLADELRGLREDQISL